MESVWLRKAECRGKVCQLLLAEGRDLLVLGKRCAADLGYRECAVLGAFPRVLTSSWDDSIHRHWTSLGPWGSLLSCFEDPPRAWVPSARVVLQQRRNKYTRQTWFTKRTTVLKCSERAGTALTHLLPLPELRCRRRLRCRRSCSGDSKRTPRLRPPTLQTHARTVACVTQLHYKKSASPPPGWTCN